MLVFSSQAQLWYREKRRAKLFPVRIFNTPSLSLKITLYSKPQIAGNIFSQR